MRGQIHRILSRKILYVFREVIKIMETYAMPSFSQLNGMAGNGERQLAAIANSHLDALKALSKSIFSEIEALQTESNMDRGNNSLIDLTKEVRLFEIGLIRTALIRTSGRQRPAAKLLGIKVTTLHEKIKRYGLLPLRESPG